jgi:hypothetical protein
MAYRAKKRFARLFGNHDGDIDDKKHREHLEMDQMSRDDGSQYSLTGIPLPSLGATAANRKPKLRSFIISPHNSRYRYIHLSL